MSGIGGHVLYADSRNLPDKRDNNVLGLKRILNNVHIRRVLRIREVGWC